jgi:Tfp pilus assembly protein PilF
MEAKMDELEKNMHYVHACNFFDNGDYSAAIAECSTAISKGVQYAPIYNIRAYSYIKQREYLKARIDFDASLQLDPTDIEIKRFRDQLQSKGF